MNAASIALRFLLRIVRHPAVQAGLKRALHAGVTEMLRHLHNSSRHKRPVKLHTQ